MARAGSYPRQRINLRMSGRLPYLAVALCFYALAAYIYFPVVDGHPYAYDEADYMWAGKQGLWANYTDQHGLSFIEFVRKGLELSRDPGKRTSFSQFIRSSGDIGLYRHYHGPIYALWLAVLQKAGVVRENVFRGSGLLIHFATATAILLGFWAVFPSLPRFGGLVACALYVFSRTGLSAATEITQHVVFAFLCVVTLFAASMFFRSLESRWFYTMMALLGVCFCALETSAVLLAALTVAFLIEHKRVRSRFPELKQLAVFLARGVAVLVITMFVCWPTGLSQLGIAKGFLTMAYMSLYRKTFSPFGTLDLWAAKFEASPWEFSLLIVGVVAAFVLWRRFGQRTELLPWLAYIAVFLLVTLKVTLPYTYYYASLAAAFCVVTGVAVGILWNRWPAPWRYVPPLLAIASMVGTTLQFSEVLRQIHDAQPYHVATLRFLQDQPVPAGQRLCLPFQLVPTLHYYHPELETLGYDVGYPIDQLAAEIASPQAAAAMLCEEAFCGAIERQHPGILAEKTLLDPVGPTGQPFYVARVRKGGV
jgi:hypothetical protein